MNTKNQSPSSTPKIAIIYDWLDTHGGAERLLTHLLDLFPQADIFTLWHTPKSFSPAADVSRHTIHTSFLQHSPIKSRRLLLPLMPFAWESFDLTGYDLVISLTSYFAKSVITRPETLHVSYICTPARYVWGGRLHVLTGPYIAYLRHWDIIAAQRPDVLLTLSHHSQAKISVRYHREAQIVQPPFDIKYWKRVGQIPVKPTPVVIPDKFFLVVSRLEPYKKVDLTINAFAHFPIPLVVVGAGSQKNKVRSLLATHPHHQSIHLENLSDAELCWLYQHAEGLIMMQEEDFGYTALEAQINTCPVLTYSHSGTVETISLGNSGITIPHQSEKSLLESLHSYNKLRPHLVNWLTKNKDKHLGQFDIIHFSETLINVITYNRNI